MPKKTLQAVLGKISDQEVRAVLDALAEYVENGNDAVESLDRKSHGLLLAADRVLGQLNAVIAALADRKED